MQKFLKVVFSGEFLFSLFLVAGSFKAAIDIPFIDVTVLLLVVTMLIAVKRFFENKLRFPKYYIAPILLFLTILLVAIVSLMYTPSTTYSIEKLLLFSVIGSWCFFGGFFLFKDENSIKRFLSGFVVLGIIMSISLIISGLTTEIRFNETFGSSYVQLARVTGMGALILLMYFMFTKSNKLLKFGSLILALILFIPLIQSGARLPFIALTVALLSVPVSMIKVRNRDVLISKKIFSILLLFVIVSTSVFILAKEGYAETLLYRMNSVIQEVESGKVIAGRTERFDTAFEMSENSYLMGMGLGSFPIYYAGTDSEDYPHSIYLELLAELGIIALAAFLTIITLSIYRGYLYYKKYGINSLNASIYMLFVFWMINSFASSSMTGDKSFFAVLSIMAMLPLLGKRGRNLNTKVNGEQTAVGTYCDINTL